MRIVDGGLPARCTHDL